MGLFFGGLRRQIEALTNELETLRKTAAEAKKETTRAVTSVISDRH